MGDTVAGNASARRLGLGAVLAFASVGAPIHIIQLAVAVHLPRYFATTLGLSLSLVGATFAFIRFIDIPIDAVLGVAMDRTRSRFGRYRLWLALGAPVLSLGFYMLIASPPQVGVLYFASWLLVMYIGYSMVYLSHFAWAGNVATDYDERSRIFGAITAMGVAGTLAALAIPIVLSLYGRTEGEGVRGMLWFLVILSPLAAILALLRTPERINRDHAEVFRLQDYAALLARPNVLRLLAADLFVTLGPGWMAAIYLYYAKDARGFDTAAANIILLGYIASGMVGAPLIASLAKRIGKHRAMIVAICGYCAALLTVPFLPKGEYLYTLAPIFLAGSMYAGQLVMLRAITGDIADEVRLDVGREQMGLMYALTNGTTKLGGAASIFLTFATLDAVGYMAEEGAVNGPAAIRALEITFVSGPVIFLALAAVCFIGYRLDHRRHDAIRRELEARDAI